MDIKQKTGTEVFRPITYEGLTEEQKSLVDQVKAKAAELYELFVKTSGRESAVAITNLEQAVMWSVKGITAPKE